MAAWIEFLAVVVGAAAMAYVIIRLVDRVRGPQPPKDDDDRTGVKIGAAFGVYGIILGFAVVAAQQSYADAEYALRGEMGAVMSVIHVAQSLPTAQGQPILDNLDHYLNSEISEWSHLSQDDFESPSLQSLRELYANVQDLSVDARAAVPQAQLLTSLAAVDTGRANRMLVNSDGTTVFMWILLIGGAMLVISMASLLSFESTRLRTLLIVGMAVLIGVALFAFWSLSSPFSGPIPIDNAPLQQVLQHVHR